MRAIQRGSPFFEADKKSRSLYCFISSGYRDSNPGPPTPEAGALTGLRYIPNRLCLLYTPGHDYAAAT